MPCFHPIKGYRQLYSGAVTKNYKNSNGIPATVPCRQCSGCRQEYSRQWAMRNMHEASLWLNNIFITLTYNDNHIPNITNAEGEIISNTLVKKDFQDFMKRLRKHKKATTKNPVRFFHCGEYGENFGRPHYHAILFNTNFRDRETLHAKGCKGLTDSETLNKLWGKGHTSIGDVTFQSASYVSGYVQKKINGQQKDSHYRVIDKSTGEEVGDRQQEYSTMSRRPGIAGLWFAKHKNDVYPSDNVHINGKEMRPPTYYDRLYEIDHRSELEIIKQNRKEKAKQFAHLRTPEALAYLEKTHKARMSIFKRGKLL